MRLLLVLPLLCVIVQAAAEPEPNFFRYQRSVHFDGAGSTAQVCVALDAGVFAHAAPGLRDLRLYNGEKEVPFALTDASAPGRNAVPPPVVLNLGERNGHVVFDAHLYDALYSTVQIETNARDFVASVEVSGSQSLGDATRTSLGTFTIFDLAGQRLGRSTVLHLPPSTFPYLHFTISGPLRADSITGLKVVDVPARTPVFSVVAESRRIEQRDRKSVVTFVTPANVPVERIEFRPAKSAGNFSRAITVEAGAEPNNRANRFTGTISRIHTIRNGIRIDNEQYAFDIIGFLPQTDTAHTRWTITVDNGDDAPLQLESVRALMHERRLCFDADPGKRYTLSYGDTALAAPRYDYASFFAGPDVAQVATLEAERANPQFQKRPDTRPLTERYPALLWGALILVVVILGVSATRAATRINRSSR